MANRYPVGSLVRATVAFKTASSGALTDPTTIVAKYEDPAGSETTKTYPDTVVKASTGRYYIDITVNAAGTWYYRFNGTGACVAADEESFVAEATQF